MLNRVRYRGETFIIERGGEPIGRLEPVRPARCTARQLADLLREGPHPDPDFWNDLESIAASQPPAPEARW
jgi:hypothetical protein